MNDVVFEDLTKSVAVMGKPYSVTRSRLGAITKIFQEKYVCDPKALKELFQSISEKLNDVPAAKTPRFSFLISFSDQTHHYGVISDLNVLDKIPTGKKTERVVLKWVVPHQIEGEDNELSVMIRISNPINPFVFLQAALSKSPDEIDNIEFEMGSTCVTVDGATQFYADEIFLRFKNWMDARNKPHPFLNVSQAYSKCEWYLDQLNSSIFPLLIVSAISFWVYDINGAETSGVKWIPIIIGFFFVLQSIGRRLNHKMASWSAKTMHISLFQMTNGDDDGLTEMASRAKNSFIKLASSCVVSVGLNIISAYICFRYLGM